MSRRRFETEIRDDGKYKEPTGECGCCDKPATHWIRWAFSYMRGEDEVYGACQRHYSMAQDTAQRGRYWAHFRSKDKFVARKAQPQETGTQP